METAYLCSNCGASVILNDDSACKCCFCGTEFHERNVIDRPNGGFYVGALTPSNLRTITCRSCGKTMGESSSSKLEPKVCLYCGSDDITSGSGEMMFPKDMIYAPFSCDRKEAEEAYLLSVKKDKIKGRAHSTREYLDALTPVYIPCFFYDYHTFANTILSVVPFVKQPRNIGEKVLSAFLITDISVERTSNVVTPYPKTIASEMAWQNLPICACNVMDQKKSDQVSPFLSKSGTTSTGSASDIKDAVILNIDRGAKEIEDNFFSRIKEFVKECVITENLEHFSITSFVDNTVYNPAVGQLIYIPFWVMKVRKKDQSLTWCMNAISGKSSEVSFEPIDKKPVKEEEPTLKSMSKKRIKAFKLEDLGGPDKPVNYRTFMIDSVASSITAEMTLNEMSADKSLLHLEKARRNSQTSLEVPIVRAYQEEAEKAVKESQKTSIPSAPVPLPTKHSPLYLMKEEAMTRSLGRGQRLPEKPLDRRVGNEAEFDNRNDTHESLAVEFGLSDLPEYDPSGPDPFKK
ncbi:MAG: hypothetical protein IKZ90_11450 [Clostridiales bacterium]|nr:hypothetical protein [Clostridiales bacterium]